MPYLTLWLLRPSLDLSARGLSRSSSNRSTSCLFSRKSFLIISNSLAPLRYFSTCYHSFLLPTLSPPRNSFISLSLEYMLFSWSRFDIRTLPKHIISEQSYLHVGRTHVFLACFHAHLFRSSIDHEDFLWL